jgi:hypothetical protein
MQLFQALEHASGIRLVNCEIVRTCHEHDEVLARFILQEMREASANLPSDVFHGRRSQLVKHVLRGEAAETAHRDFAGDAGRLQGSCEEWSVRFEVLSLRTKASCEAVAIAKNAVLPAILGLHFWHRRQNGDSICGGAGDARGHTHLVLWLHSGAHRARGIAQQWSLGDLRRLSEPTS